MHAVRLFLSFILTQLANSSVSSETDELATFLSGDGNYDSEWLSNDDMTNFAADESILLSEDPLFSSDIDLPTVIAQGGPGSPAQFNDNPPNDDPKCKFPKHIRCCPIDIFTRCVHYNPGHPLCMSSRTLYCCQNIPLKNDEGDELGWDFVCDKDVILPSFDDRIGNEILEFLRTDVGDWIPPIPFGIGDHQFGFP